MIGNDQIRVLRAKILRAKIFKLSEFEDMIFVKK